MFSSTMEVSTRCSGSIGKDPYINLEGRAGSGGRLPRRGDADLGPWGQGKLVMSRERGPRRAYG